MALYFQQTVLKQHANAIWCQCKDQKTHQQVQYYSVNAQTIFKHTIQIMHDVCYPIRTAQITSISNVNSSMVASFFYKNRLIAFLAIILHVYNAQNHTGVV